MQSFGGHNAIWPWYWCWRWMKIHCLDRQNMSSYTLAIINIALWSNIMKILSSKMEQKHSIFSHFGKTCTIQSNENLSQFLLQIELIQNNRYIFWEYWIILCSSFAGEVASVFSPWPPPRQIEVKFQKNKNGRMLSITFCIIYDDFWRQSCSLLLVK